MLREFLSRIATPRKWAFVALAAVAFAFLLRVYIGIWVPGYGITRFLIVGTEFNKRGTEVFRATPKIVGPSPWGFDGQFYAEIALDPLLRDPQLKIALDGPVYRSRRILISWLAWLGGLGKPVWILNAYAAMNLVFWVAYAWLAMRLFRPLGWAGLAGFAAVLLTCGLLESMQASLTDFPSIVLLLGAVVLGGTGGAGLLAAACLAREANVIGLVALMEFKPPWKRAFRANVVRGAIALVPLVLWAAFVLWRFSDRPADLEGGNLGQPLRGIMEKLGELSVTLFDGHVRWHRWYTLYNSYDLHAALTIVSVLTQIIYVALHRDWTSRLWRIAAIFGVYFLCIGYLSWESHLNVTRHALPFTFVFNLMLATRPRRGWAIWFLIGNCFVPFGLLNFYQKIHDSPPVLPAEFVVAAPPTGAGSLRAVYADGWSGQVIDSTTTGRWATGNQAVLILHNDSKQTLQAELRFRSRSTRTRTLTAILGKAVVRKVKLGKGPQIVDLPLELAPGENRLVFNVTGPAGRAPNGLPGVVTFKVEAPRFAIGPPP